MLDSRKSCFNWNHVSKDLSEEQIVELKSYYKSYHRKAFAFKLAYKHFKRCKILGHGLSILFASGGIISSAVTSGLSLITISSVAIFIQGYLEHKNYNLKIRDCEYAYHSYEHLLITIKNILRSGIYDSTSLYHQMAGMDNYIIDNSPVIDKYLAKYDKIFSDQELLESHHQSKN